MQNGSNLIIFMLENVFSQNSESDNAQTFFEL